MYNDCENIVNFNECCIYHCECNGCMPCADYKPKQPVEIIVDPTNPYNNFNPFYK